METETDQRRMVEAEVLLLWVRSHRNHYRRLSLNITREISSYFDLPLPVVVIGNNFVYLFDLFTSTWKQEIQIPDAEALLRSNSRNVTQRRLRKNWEVDARYQSVLVSRHSAFLYKADTRCSQAFLVDFSGEITAQPRMDNKRSAFGLVYHRGAVYAFGGVCVWAASLLTFRCCEALTLPESHWKALPDMQVSRCYFNPCAHQSTIWLCGGFHPSVELFQTETQMYSFLPAFPALDKSPTVAVACSNFIIVITSTIMHTWDLRSSTYRTRARNAHVTQSQSSPIVYNERLYILHQAWLANYISQINLRNGIEVHKF